MGGLARPVDPAIGKQIRGDLLGRLRILDSADIEARKVQVPLGGPERHERKVRILLDHDHQGRLLTLEVHQFRELSTAAIRRGHGQNRLAIPADNLDSRAVDGFTGTDRLHENIAAAVFRLFNDETKVRDQNQTGILDPRNSTTGVAVRSILLFPGLRLLVYRTDVQKKQSATLLVLVEQVLPQVDTVVGRFARLSAAIVFRGREAFDQTVFQVLVDIRPGEVVHLGREMLQLIGLKTSDVDLDLCDITHKEADFPVTGHRKQRALSQKGEGLAIRLDLKGRDERPCGNVSAGSLDPILHGQKYVAAHRREKLEAVNRVGSVFRRDNREIEGLRSGEDIVAHLNRVLPAVRLFVFCALVRMADRQHIGGDLSGQGFLGYGRGTIKQNNLLGFVARVVHQRHVRAGKLQAGAAGNGDYRFQTIARGIASSRRTNAFVD